MPTQAVNETPFDMTENYLREANNMRVGHIHRAEQNDQQYRGLYDIGVDRLSGRSYFVINKTQKSVISLTSVQIEQRPRIDLKPRENAIDDELFMTRKGLMTVERAIQDGVIFNEPDPDDDDLGLDEDAGVQVEEQGFDFSALEREPDREAFPVEPAFVERIAPMLQPLQEGELPLLRQEDFLTINDSIVAKVLQNNIDILWEEGNNDQWLMDSLLNNNILGWQPSLYQWDEELMRDVTRTMHIKDVWIDPNVSNVEDAEYVIIRELVSISEAKERYPKAAQKIAAATIHHAAGLMDDSFTADGDFGDILRDFERPMIYIWTAWYRNARYDMSPDDAIEFGKIVISEDGEMFLADEDGQPTDKKTSVGADNWPKRRSTRQLQFVADQTVFDEEIAHWDIPILWMKNIPEPYRPYGIGEPDALEWIDNLINKLSSILFDHFKYYRSWSEIYPTDVWDSIAAKEFKETRHSHPGRIYSIEAHLYEKYKDVLAHGRGFMIAPPPMPESAFQYLQFMLKLHDDISGNTEALQGRLPSSSTSGKALQTLQAAAKGVVGFKSIQTESTLRRLTRLRVHGMTKWLPLFMWKKWNDQYPQEVLDAIRLRAKHMEWEVSAEVVSGGGQVREQKMNQVRQDFSVGIIDQVEALERLNYDAGPIQERLAAVASQQSQGTQVNA